MSQESFLKNPQHSEALFSAGAHRFTNVGLESIIACSCFLVYSSQCSEWTLQKRALGLQQVSAVLSHANARQLRQMGSKSTTSQSRSSRFATLSLHPPSAPCSYLRPQQHPLHCIKSRFQSSATTCCVFFFQCFAILATSQLLPLPCQCTAHCQ